MDYCLHNYFNYDINNYDFRRVVLYALRNHICCLHLRDKSFSELSLYDVNSWLADTTRDSEDIAATKVQLEQAIANKNAVTEETLQAAYQQEVSKVESLRQCKNSYHNDTVKKISKCAKVYRHDLDLFLEQDDEAYSLLTVEDLLEDIYSTAIKDANYHSQENLDAVVKMHQTPLISYEEFCINYKKQLDDFIDLYRGKIKRLERLVETAEAGNKLIIGVFNALDRWEKAKLAEVQQVEENN